MSVVLGPIVRSLRINLTAIRVLITSYKGITRMWAVLAFLQRRNAVGRGPMHPRIMYG